MIIVETLDVSFFIVRAFTYIISLHPLNNLVGNTVKKQNCLPFKDEDTGSQS